MVKIILPKNEKSSGIIVRILAVVVTVLLAATAFFCITALNQKISWEKLNATVIDFDTSDGTDVWTEFLYKYDNQMYKYRQKGHSYWMKKGAQIEIYCNPDTPQDIVVAEKMFGLTYVMLGITGLFGVYFAIYVLNHFRVKSRARRVAEQKNIAEYNNRA
ncbi:MAG: DUF3592 domain-containing protein [Acutalibacteraceae bacterium]|nr:DUF3592 domain-containing protein [Acutalibacteraceae bacterium]